MDYAGQAENICRLPEGDSPPVMTFMEPSVICEGALSKSKAVAEYVYQLGTTCNCGSVLSIVTESVTQ